MPESCKGCERDLTHLLKAQAKHWPEVGAPHNWMEMLYT